MAETLEELKARAKLLRNKPPANTAFASTDMVTGKKRDGAKKGSQTSGKAARKPSV